MGGILKVVRGLVKVQPSSCQITATELFGLDFGCRGNFALTTARGCGIYGYELHREHVLRTVAFRHADTLSRCGSRSLRDTRSDSFSRALLLPRLDAAKFSTTGPKLSDQSDSLGPQASLASCSSEPGSPIDSGVGLTEDVQGSRRRELELLVDCRQVGLNSVVLQFCPPDSNIARRETRLSQYLRISTGPASMGDSSSVVPEGSNSSLNCGDSPNSTVSSSNKDDSRYSAAPSSNVDSKHRGSEPKSSNTNSEQHPSARETDPRVCQEALDAAARARAAEKLWDTLVPDRKIGLGSPVFWVLLVVCIVLHLYNEATLSSDGSSNDATSVKERELRDTAERKRLTRCRESMDSGTATNEGAGTSSRPGPL